MSEIKLLPCPFCGGEGSAYIDRYDKYFTGCEKCNFYYGIEIEHDCELEDGWLAIHDSKEEAINAWNTRKPIDRNVEQLESLSNAEADYYYASSNDVIDRETAIEMVREGGGKV